MTERSSIFVFDSYLVVLEHNFGRNANEFQDWFANPSSYMDELFLI
jgi:hypothetical protein